MSVSWFIVAGVCATYLICWRATFAKWYDDFKDDWGWGYLIAGLVLTFVVASFYGPFLLLSESRWTASRASRQRAQWLGALLAGEDRRSNQERQADRIAELERENARLEQELGVSGA